MEIYKVKFGNFERGWVVLVYGFGEYSGRYGKFILMFNEVGFVVYIFDWLGYGKSFGKRGYISVEEVMEIIDFIIKELGEKFFFFGYSFGGLIVICYVEIRLDKICGVVVFFLVLVKSFKILGFMVVFVKVLGRIVFGLIFFNGIDLNFFLRNLDVVKCYIEDLLVYDRILIKFGMSIFKNMELVYREVDRIEVFIFLFVGIGDVIIFFEGLRKFFEEFKVKDKEIREFEGVYYEIFEDFEWGEEFYKMIVEWFIKYLEKV